MPTRRRPDRPEIDRNDLEVLPREECLALLASATIGRIGLSADALPLVLPVNHCLDGDRIVFRTGEGTKLASATRNAVVCFEVDGIDPVFHDGWSVVVTGIAAPIESDEELAHARSLPLVPWAAAGDHYVSVSLEDVSGRRLRPGAPEPPPRAVWR
jgi:nitroimidazol reductase NimA-like FMN-containing flavoprotein (pyridoxamine 5'-phosphate oxidase superfamily)